MIGDFKGIPCAAPRFLAQLAANNRRDWFESHKADYQAVVLTPMRQLAAALAPTMLAIDPGFETDPRRTVSRIHRDTRFSRDKSPYRVNQWLTFKRPAEAWADRPAYFLQFGAADYAYGMGFYQATPATMAALRDVIRRIPDRFIQAAAAAEQAGLRLEGEPYRRPRGLDGLPPLAADWCRRKTAYVVAEQPVGEDFYAADLAERLADVFVALAPLYAFVDAACRSAPTVASTGA